jgi:hypothetical protein
METILPVLDNKVLQEKANEFAMKGAIDTIKEYYTGYNSPFKEAFDSHLKGKDIHFGFEIPDIISRMNEALMQQADLIANHAIAQTLIPQFKELLTRAEATMNFSDILKTFIDVNYGVKYDDCSVEITNPRDYHEKPDIYDWLNVQIASDERTYRFTLHKHDKKESGKNAKYTLLSLPSFDKNSTQTMTLYLDDIKGSVEMPFVPNVLSDRFVSFMARLVMSSTIITLDTQEFDENMFPERCHCD